MSSLVVEAALARYGREHNRYLQVADAVASRCRRLANEAGIRAPVQWRVKSPEHVRAKLERIVPAPAGNAEAGREPMIAAIQRTYREVDIEVKLQADRFYRGTYCQLRLSREDAAELPPELLGLSCEVQVCSLLAQVWNEIEHGLVYAGTSEPSPEEQATLHALGRMTEAGDALVTMLLTLEGRAEQ